MDVDQWAVDHWLRLLICEQCDRYDHTVALRTAATAYSDPESNRPLLLCDKCADEYYEHWNERWQEYYASQR